MLQSCRKREVPMEYDHHGLTLLQKCLIGALLIGIALGTAWAGLRYETSINCRNLNNPADYGQRFCIPPIRAPEKPGS